jgi:gluconate kinase
LRIYYLSIDINWVSNNNKKGRLLTNTTAPLNKQSRSPTLNTIKMVEETLRNMDESIISVAELKRKLPKQVNHNTLTTILEYLEESDKIAVTIKGITWIHNDHPGLNKAISRGIEL